MPDKIELLDETLETIVLLSKKLGLVRQQKQNKGLKFSKSDRSTIKLDF